jgi:hydroxyacylglutathione hydrolase
VLAEVAPGVWVATSTVFATTSTVLVDGDGAALVVDPGVTSTERDGLADEVAERGWRVVGGLATHAHWDHLLWSPALGDGPRWALPATAEAARTGREALLAELEESLGAADEATVATFGDLRPVLDGPVPGLPGAVLLRHDGHAVGHGVVLVPGARALLVGDMLSDVEVPLLGLADPHPISAYADGLALLRLLLDRGDVDVVVPGHGSVADLSEARRRLRLDEAYLVGLAAGRPVSDPRLGDAPRWLLAEHDAQVRALTSVTSG